MKNNYFKNLHLGTIATIFLLFFMSASIKANVYYWVGGTGNWSKYNTHWATTSGGVVFHIQTPTPTDTVIFDSHSFASINDTVYVDSTLITCHNMIWTNVTNHPVFINQYYSPNTIFKIYGSLTLSPNMTWNYNGNMYFEATSGGNTITSASQSLGNIILEGIGGQWDLLDSLTSGISITAGTFRTNNQKINANGFYIQPPVAANVFLGKSIINCTNYTCSNPTILDADSSFIFTGGFTGGTNYTYNNVNVTGNITGFSATTCNFNVVTLTKNGTANNSGCNIDSLLCPKGLLLGGTSNTIHYTKADNGLNISGANNMFQYLQASGDATISSNNIYDTLYFNNPGHIVKLGAGTTQTINNEILVNGTCSGLTTFVSSMPGTQATLSVPSGTIVLSYVLLQDMNATGGAFFSAYNSVAVSNVTGWMVNASTPQNLYWVGGKGHWDDASHWANTSGGSGGSCVPSPVDNVFFDAASFTTANDTVFIDSSIAYCKNMNWTGVNNNPVTTGTVNLRVYGSLTLSPNMLWNYTGSMYFEATSGGNTITSASQNLSTIILEGIGGQWDLLDSLTSSIAVNAGTFRTNNHKINASTFAIQPPTVATVFLGKSIINCNTYTCANPAILHADSSFIYTDWFNGGSNYTYNNLTVNGNSTYLNATFCNFNVVTLINNPSAYNYGCIIDSLLCPNGLLLVGGVNTIHYTKVDNGLNIGGVTNTFQYLQTSGDVTISSNNTYDTLYFNNPGHIVTLGAGTTQTINNEILVNGTCSGLTTFVSNTPGTQAILSVPSGTVTLSYVLLQDMNAIGGATFLANNSVAVSNVTGWMVNAPTPQNLYWVGGKGHWDDASHWANTSGGSGGSCVPSPVDNVFFDAASFTTANDTVFIDSSIAYCKNMSWTGVNNNPVTTGTVNLRVYGSLTLSPNMLWNYIGNMYFEATSSGNTITSASQSLNNIILEGIGGQWDLLDSLTSGISITAGTFRTNNQKINANGFYIQPPTVATVFLGKSIINCNTYACANLAILHADSSFIYTNWFSGGTNYNYNNVTVTGNFTYLDATSCNFNVVTLINSPSANNSKCIIDSLLCPNGLLLAGDTNTIHYTKVDNGLNISGVKNMFQYLQASGDATISTNNTYDTLNFNNPGHIITLGAGTTQTINHKLQINASGGFPVSLISSVAGTHATISQAIDTVCVDYIYMQDINASGGAQFYAGMYSSNISNNSGWQWTNCIQPISNVWPGDANYDLTTDNLDILYIGMAYNETGFTRPGASLTYTAQPCLDWNTVYTNLVNVKHADCDGNGLIDANDTMAVSVNYGMANTGRLVSPQQTQSTNSSNPDLYFAPTQTTYLPGSFVSIPINLGTSAMQASNVYGMAFTIQYDASQIQAGSVHISYNSSWLVPINNIVHLEKDFYATSHIDVGVARINHTNISGNGTVAYLTFQIANNAVNGTINVSFANVTAMDVNQTIIPVNTINNVVTVGIHSIQNNVSDVTIFPNPFMDQTAINYTLASASNVAVTIYTPEGMQVATLEEKTETAGQHILNWDTKSLAAGIYLCKIKCNDGEKVLKLIKTE